MSVPAIMQWLTGQRHKPCLPSERASFKIHVRFEHQCKDTMPGHYICYPLVSACTNTIIFPVAHMNSYTEFTEFMTTAVTMGRDFSRVQLTLKQHAITSYAVLHCISTICVTLQTYFSSWNSVRKEKRFTVRLFFHVVSLTFCSYNVKNYVHKTEEPIQKTAFIKT